MKKYLPQRLPLRVLPLVAGAGIFLVAATSYIPGLPTDGWRIALLRDTNRFMASVMPPKDATKMLDVPFHQQEHALSCEVAALFSALRGIGADVTESGLITELPKDPTPKVVTSKNSFTWGDPQKGFVGNIDGVMPRTGYGVYAGPISVVASKYATVTPIASDDAAAIIRAIDAGHPIVAWTVLGAHPSALNWKTSDGTDVHGALYEHAVVVIGYKTGTAGDVQKVYLMDPEYGLRTAAWKDFIWRAGFVDHQALEIAPLASGS